MQSAPRSVNQRLNFRTVKVGPLIEDGEPTTATREPSGRRVLRMGFWLVRSCPRRRATRSIAACKRSLVYGVESAMCSTTPPRSAIDAGRPVNHQVGDGRVKQQRPQLFGKERQYQLEAHRTAPAAGCAMAAGRGIAAPGAMGSTDTRFSWNSVMVNPSGLMNSILRVNLGLIADLFGIQVVGQTQHPMLGPRLVRMVWASRVCRWRPSAVPRAMFAPCTSSAPTWT